MGRKPAAGRAKGDGRGTGDLDIGARLRAVREKAGLSQRELARKAGVTNSTISLIEQEAHSPSLASLHQSQSHSSSLSSRHPSQSHSSSNRSSSLNGSSSSK